MRIGQNPLKTTQAKINPPASITVGVLNYIPDQTGYFKEQFDSLKLCLASIRANAEYPFELLVADNGSCDDVQDYLFTELKNGNIHQLILNHQNIGKGNALFQILRSATGNIIFYTDGDIYFRPSYMKAHLDVLNAFPNAGIIGGIPLRNLANFHAASTHNWAELNQNSLFLEKGDLIPEDWTRDFLRSVGEEKFIENWIHNEDWRITRNGTTAYIGASHMQFLIPRSAVQTIPERRFTGALDTSDDQYFDNAIEEAKLLRLSVARPYVYHIGNSISEPWLIEEYKRLVIDAPVPARRIINGQKFSLTHWFWRRWRVRLVLKAVYEWAFSKYNENV